MFIVYQLVNKINGKSYIGITKRSMACRLAQHERTARSDKPSFVKHYLHHAIRKYGWSNFEANIVEENIYSKEIALLREQYYINLFKTNINGYNLTPGGDHLIDSDWQRENQLKRVQNGTHPFVGGKIQHETGKRLWIEGKHNFIGLNEKRIEKGTHNFLGHNNPTRKLAKLGLQHNQKAPWLNSKIKTNPDALRAWQLADQLYCHLTQQTGRYGYSSLAKDFNLNTSLIKICDKFKAGWNPAKDPAWLAWRDSVIACETYR